MPTHIQTKETSIVLPNNEKEVYNNHFFIRNTRSIKIDSNNTIKLIKKKRIIKSY